MRSSAARGRAPRRASAPERDPDADRQFVEEMALLLELYSRLPRVAGRIYALLLVSDHPGMSQQELAEALSVSQASVSAMTRKLVDDGLIERFRPAGSRRDHYRLRPQSWTGMLNAAVVSIRRVVEQTERGLALPGPDIGAGRQQLRELHDVYQRLHDWFVAAANASTD